MTTPAVMITNMRRFAHVNTTQYPDADAYKDLNHMKDEIWNKVVNEGISSYYNWDIWQTSTVALQWEYRLEIPTSTVAGQKTLNNVYLNYDGETYTNTGLLKYIKATEVDPKNLPNEWGFYQENQSVDYPIYYQKDNSIFIAPMPLASTYGTNRIQLEGIRKIADWTSSTTELETKFPIEFHYIFELGLLPYGLMSKGSDDTSIANARNSYLNASRDVVIQMTSRLESPFYNRYPDQITDDSLRITIAS